ncbi:MAG TPA: hypothetical protein VNS32_20530, partial [Flavisolibacter sp.]|nr:hypothetical protein [Flavisolibacter sp.]
LFKALPNMAASQKEAALNELIQRVIVPYICVGALLVLLGLLIKFSPLPEIDTEQESEDVAQANSSKSSIFQFPHLILGAIAIFVHVGTQVISIDTIIGYATSMNISLMEAKVFPSYTLFATICGYIIGIICIPRFISQATALRICVILGIMFTLCIIYTNGEVSWLGHTTDISIWFVALLGLANSLVWPGIWPLALEGLGRYTKLGASIMVMGLAGNAILPVLYGHFADVAGHRAAYWILFPCYLYLIYYSFYGYSIRSWSLKSSPERKVVSSAEFKMK